jgi:pyruvate/2-oxoglutarate/acetoin dehydrogenase E1 component
MKYLEEVDKGMKLLADSNTYIIGQAVKYKGHAITRQASFWPENKKLELPVAEEMQTGIALGMSINGDTVVSIYPRINFLICAANQIFNHLDKWEKMGCGIPHVILKAVVGSEYPLDPGHQHKADWSYSIKNMCDSINVYNLLYSHQVFAAYQNAINKNGVHLLIEHGDLYNA